MIGYTTCPDNPLPRLPAGDVWSKDTHVWACVRIEVRGFSKGLKASFIVHCTLLRFSATFRTLGRVLAGTGRPCTVRQTVWYVEKKHTFRSVAYRYVWTCVGGV
jgi:hypothetical protein